METKINVICCRLIVCYTGTLYHGIGLLWMYGYIFFWEPGHSLPTNIRAGWLESSLSIWRRFQPSATESARWRLWSDFANAQADLSLRWAHMQSCRKCYAAAEINLYFVIIILAVSQSFTIEYNITKKEVKIKKKKKKIHFHNLCCFLKIYHWFQQTF